MMMFVPVVVWTLLYKHSPVLGERGWYRAWRWVPHTRLLLGLRSA